MLPVAVLVMVNVRVVLPLSAIVAALKALVSAGMLPTLKHASPPVMATLVAVTLACRLVRLACGQVPVTPVALVSPATVMVQLAVPLVTAMAFSPERTRVPVL